MVDISLLPAIKAALRANEIGGGNPYQLSFAEVGSSGASFGVFQGDTAQNPNALACLRNVLDGAGLDPGWINDMIGILGKPCPQNPLSAADEAAINTALQSAQGQALVDGLDELSLTAVCTDLDLCTAAAGGVGSSINGDAQLAICLWCNMSGRPTLLLNWLRGNTVGGVAAPGKPAALGDVRAYLQASAFFEAHPQNWTHFAASVAVGAALLPPVAAG